MHFEKITYAKAQEDDRRFARFDLESLFTHFTAQAIYAVLIRAYKRPVRLTKAGLAADVGYFLGANDLQADFTNTLNFQNYYELTFGQYPEVAEILVLCHPENADQTVNHE